MSMSGYQQYQRLGDVPPCQSNDRGLITSPQLRRSVQLRAPSKAQGGGRRRAPDVSGGVQGLGSRTSTMKAVSVQNEMLDEAGIKADGITPTPQEKAQEARPIPSYFKLYSHAEPFDCFLIAIGTLGAVAAGVTMPLFTVVFGQLVNTYGGGPVTSSQINEIALNFVYLAIASLVASFFEFSFFCWSGAHVLLQPARAVLSDRLASGGDRRSVHALRQVTG